MNGEQGEAGYRGTSAMTGVRTTGTGCLSDSRAFEVWAMPHRDGLRRLARRLTGNSTDAEDLVQEAILRGYSRREQVNDRATVGAWLATILKNLFINERRRESARPRVVPLSSLGVFAESVLNLPVTDTHTSTEAVALNRCVAEAIFRAVDRLAPALRQALLLCDVEGLSYEEIAVSVGVPIGTVRSRIFRARAEVRRLLPSMYRQIADSGI